MRKAKEYMNEFMDKLNNGYFDKLETKEKEWLESFVTKLYHVDMQQLKIDMDLYRYWEPDITKQVKRVPAGSWVYVDQDEGGIYIWDEEGDYLAEVDYSVSPNELFI